MSKIGFSGILLVLFSLFIVEVISFTQGVTTAPNPLYERTEIYIVLMGIFSLGLIVFDYFLLSKKSRNRKT